MRLELARTTDGRDLGLLPAFANRHGLISGATGTGKTVTLQVLAENFARIGASVVLADVKGDLSGLAVPGASSAKLERRLSEIGMQPPEWSGSPLELWDVFGRRGTPLRATVSDMGPLLLAKLLGCNETQRGVLTLTFRAADDAGLLLLDLKDLRAMLRFVGENAAQFRLEYGQVSSASIGAIQRSLLEIEEQGGERFFGEPMLESGDLLLPAADGRGVVHAVAADELVRSPRVYAAFLLWLLSELHENLPEVGDLERPKLVFFFDEAHLLFEDAEPALAEKIEQVVRLIRSKGVGVYFVTQNPRDVPDDILAQLGHRIHHALRASTPREQKAVRAAAETMPVNPAFDSAKVITELAVGEALVSLLDERGAPGMVERAWIRPPASRMGVLTDAERANVRGASRFDARYGRAVDRESAHETLQERSATRGLPAPGSTAAERGGGGRPSGTGSLADILLGSTGPRGGRREGAIEAAAKSAARSLGSGLGRQLLRGILGSLTGSRR